MLQQRHREEAFETELSVAEEERIRADERRRVLAEIGHADGARDGIDWRTAPPPFGAASVADDRATSSARPTSSADPAPDDPRRWDIPDDRWERDGGRRPAAGRTGMVTVRTAELPVTAPQPVVAETITERGFSPGQILIALAGACALALGIVAVSRTGLQTPLSQPIEPVLGWDHTAVLGLLEIGAGAMLLLASLHPRTRWLGGLIGLAAVAGGVVIVADLDSGVERWIADELAAERAFGWVAIGIGLVAFVGAIIPRSRHTHVVTASRPLLT